jgi:hypothetical protein
MPQGLYASRLRVLATTDNFIITVNKKYFDEHTLSEPKLGTNSITCTHFVPDLILQVSVFWDVTLCNLAAIYQHFRATSCIHMLSKQSGMVL